jgi:hypothetical protein
MKLKNWLSLAAVWMLGWFISFGVTVVITVGIVLVVMSWIVTVAVVFELTPPYKPLAGLTGLVTAAALVAFNHISKR